MTIQRNTGSCEELVAAALTSMLGPDVAVATALANDFGGGLFPEEQAYIAGAHPRRRAEFGAARLCARHALAEIGIGPCPLVPHADRAPSWPPGVAGSISHAGLCVAAAVTRSPDILSVGIDLEEDEPLDADLEAAICTPPERAWLDGFEAAERGSLAKLLFSAKEAFYKAQYPLTRTFLDFPDVTLAVDPQAGTFRVAGLSPAASLWDLVGAAEGRYVRAAGLVIATALVPRAAIASGTTRPLASGHSLP